MFSNSGSSGRDPNIALFTDATLGVAKVTEEFSYAHLTTDGQVKATAGLLGKITINTPAAGTITIYDNPALAGTVIGVITVVASVSPYTLTYNVVCSTGIYLDFSATMDVTVSYR